MCVNRNFRDERDFARYIALAIAKIDTVGRLVDDGHLVERRIWAILRRLIERVC